MQCVILVGGLGTRLGALTRDCPKPMLPVGGRPFVERLIDNAARFGFDRFLLLAGYRADQVAAHFAAGVHRTPGGPVAVSVLAEPEPLGTGGALRFAADWLEPRFLMMNGDSLFRFNLLDLAAPTLGPGSLGRIALRRVPDASRYGVVERDAAGRVLRLRERPEAAGPGDINGGVYWLDRAILDLIPESGAVSLERETFPAAIARGGLEARLHDGFFLDIGVPADYAAAQTADLERRPAIFFDRDGVLNHDRGYTHRIADLRWTDGAIAAVRRANDADRYVFVVTNQAGVARGLYPEDAVRRLHAHMAAALAEQGAHVDDWRYCPHHPDAATPAYRADCPWRKPRPGMILDLIARWPVDAARSVLIGDRETDLQAAAAAGVAGRLHRPDGDLDAAVAAVLAD